MVASVLHTVTICCAPAASASWAICSMAAITSSRTAVSVWASMASASVAATVDLVGGPIHEILGVDELLGQKFTHQVGIDREVAKKTAKVGAHR
jgi:hypothetical protein